MNTFAELLKNLKASSAYEPPAPEYKSGLGYVAWCLWQLMCEGGDAAKIAAIKEIVDRCQGRTATSAAPQMSDADAILNTLALERLSKDEARELGRLLLKSSPACDPDCAE